MTPTDEELRKTPLEWLQWLAENAGDMSVSSMELGAEVVIAEVAQMGADRLRAAEGEIQGRDNTIDALTFLKKQAEADRDAALRECAKLAREAGEATGKLETSEAAGIVEGWKERAEALQQERDEAREIVAWCNNSLFGSHGYFTHASGKRACDAIEDLKSANRAATERAEAAERRAGGLEKALDDIAHRSMFSDKDAIVRHARTALGGTNAR